MDDDFESEDPESQEVNLLEGNSSSGTSDFESLSTLTSPLENAFTFDSEEQDSNFYFTPTEEEIANVKEIEKGIQSNQQSSINSNNNSSDIKGEDGLQKQTTEIKDKTEEKVKDVKIEWEESEITDAAMGNMNVVLDSSKMGFLQRFIYQPHLQHSKLAIFLLVLLATFELILMISGFILGKPNTILFCVALFPFQFIWAYLVYLRSEKARNSAPSNRVIESYALSFFIQSFLFFTEWCLSYLIIYLINYIYFQSGGKDYLLWAMVFSAIICISFYSAFVEETAKYFILFRNSKIFGFQSRYSIILYSIAASLAIALFTGTLATFIIYWLFGVVYGIATLFIEGALTTTMHVIAGTWIALAYIKHLFRNNTINDQEFGNHMFLINILLPSICLHGSYACLILSLRMLYPFGQISWQLYFFIIIIASIFLALAAAITVVRARKILRDPNLYHSLSPIPV